MPRTIDHIVATHQLAADRRRQGRPIWDETIDVSDVFHNEDMSFEEIRDVVVAKIKASRWYRKADPHDFNGVREITDDHLAHADDVDEFDGWWDELYDLADYARVWIKTV
ncbi:hypothetical protein [Nocardia otitidiscaviarum]|uniref:hypothetical protein n=1 Tax=Nocardia otitidiscaviarum TaxID=1823 RepID=UPI0005BDDC43|nr:hypothetical protein [Nocardia otitidiscaviarum]